MCLQWLVPVVSYLFHFKLYYRSWGLSCCHGVCRRLDDEDSKLNLRWKSSRTNHYAIARYYLQAGPSGCSVFCLVLDDTSWSCQLVWPASTPRGQIHCHDLYLIHIWALRLQECELASSGLEFWEISPTVTIILRLSVLFKLSSAFKSMGPNRLVFLITMYKYEVRWSWVTFYRKFTEVWGKANAVSFESLNLN